MGYPTEKKSDGSRRNTAVCGTLCMCMAVSVLSSVALVYLTVIIYLPASRELSSGIGERSVMCTTVQRKEIVDDILACKWSSCGEWCLSKGGGTCTHLYVSVRSNGTDIHFEGCTDFVTKTCASLDMSKISTKNCKEDHQCTRLDKLFRCFDGLCYNISQVYTCHWNPEDVETDPPSVDCIKKRNCINMEGNYDCHQGRCVRLKSWSCERRCDQFPSKDRNVIVIAGDRILFSNCQRAINIRSGEVIWNHKNNIGKTLISSCTYLGNTSQNLYAGDCINGSLLESDWLKKAENYTTLMSVFHEKAFANKLDVHGEKIPFEKDIIIFEKSRLKINTEGCVNTLQGECKEFYELFGKDGRNFTSPSRFPCYYAPDNSDFVVQRFNLNRTKWLFLIFFIVPSCLLIISCSVLFICSRILTVDNNGQMNIVCCKSNLELEDDEDTNDF